MRTKNNINITITIILLTAVLHTSCVFTSFGSTKTMSSSVMGDTEIFQLKNPPSDEEITAALEVELIIQDGVNSNDIDVITQEGIVTLTGTAKHILAKERAVAICKAMKGVRSVIDNVKVEKVHISDEDLKSNITNALLFDPATDLYEIDVKVNDGNVYLNGEVNSWQEKQLTSTVVKGVMGVRSVSNDVNFIYKKNRLDPEIKNDIEQTLKWDVRVDDALVNVKVKNGKVSISGTVGSAAEYSQVEIDSWVTGVKSVNTDKLKVELWARDADLRTNKYVSKPDSEIKQAVKDAFLYDPRVLSFNPNVVVDNGEVTLTGVVDNLKAKKAAEIDAKNVVGVWRVVNLLKVRGIDFPSDETIKDNIEAALTWNPYVEKNEVDVSVINGVVYLSGVVDNYLDMYEAENVASAITGVKALENNLSVPGESLPFVYDYRQSYYYPFGIRNNYGYTPVKTDWEIKSDVEDQIFWSPNVNLDDISIEVDDGVVNLTGTVDTWNEYYHAEMNAFEGGALVVDNDLNISYLE